MVLGLLSEPMRVPVPLRLSAQERVSESGRELEPERLLVRLARGVLPPDVHLAGALRASCRGDLAARANRLCPPVPRQRSDRTSREFPDGRGRDPVFRGFRMPVARE